MDEDAWPRVKAGRRDASALRDLVASCSYAPSGLLAAAISRRLMSGYRRTAAHGFESRSASKSDLKFNN